MLPNIIPAPTKGYFFINYQLIILNNRLHNPLISLPLIYRKQVLEHTAI